MKIGGTDHKKDSQRSQIKPKKITKNIINNRSFLLSNKMNLQMRESIPVWLVAKIICKLSLQ